MFIDTHAHLNFREFGDEIPEVIKRAEIVEVKQIINIGSNFDTSKKSVELASEYQNLFASVGIHPIHLASDIVETAKFDGKEYSFKTRKEDFNYEKFFELAKSSNKVVAIGETGLDYFRINENNNFQFSINNFQSNSNDSILKTKQIQKKVFEEHIRLAEELGLPLILHCRGSEDNLYDAYDDMLNIIENCKLKTENFPKGVIHCFGGNLDQAKEFIKFGFYIGFTGIVTFKNATELQNIAREIPLNKILIETDCPFLAPVPYRGKRNEPAYVVEVARKIAELKNISIDEVESVTTQNAKNLFKI